MIFSVRQFRTSPGVLFSACVPVGFPAVGKADYGARRIAFGSGWQKEIAAGAIASKMPVSPLNTSPRALESALGTALRNSQPGRWKARSESKRILHMLKKAASKILQRLEVVSWTPVSIYPPPDNDI